jgi:ATP-binding cassette, subfamily B, bacterial
MRTKTNCTEENKLFTKVNKIIKKVFDNTIILIRSFKLLGAAAFQDTLFVALTLLLQGLIPAANVWLTTQIVNAVAETISQRGELDRGAISLYTFAWIGVLLLGALLTPWVAEAQGNLNEKFVAYIHLLLIKKADSLPGLQYFEEPLFYDELQIVQEQTSYALSLLASINHSGKEFFTIVSLSALLIPLGWWIPVLMVTTMLPGAYVALQLQAGAWKITSRRSPEARWLKYCLSIMFTDTYAKEVRLFNLGNFLILRYQKAFEEMHRPMRRLRRKQTLWSTYTILLNSLGNGFAFYWIVQKAVSGQVGAGSLLLFVQSLAYIQLNLSGIIVSVRSVYDSMTYMHRFFKFIDAKPIIKVCFPGKAVPNPLKKGITFEQVQFSYPDGRTALEDISFTLRPGETVALVGENGAGKSTLVKLLARLYDPTGGKILVDGELLTDFNLKQWRQNIAIIFQDFGRYSFTLGENITLEELNLPEDLSRLEYAQVKANISELVKKLPQGHETPLGKQFSGTELSGGQWQKLALARAFVREDKAQLLILDEPTAALDPKSESEIYNRFTELSQDKMTILITHRLASVKMANRIFVLKDGRIVESGNHATLKDKKGEYAKLWKLQAKHYQESSRNEII